MEPQSADGYCKSLGRIKNIIACKSFRVQYIRECLWGEECIWLRRNFKVFLGNSVTNSVVVCLVRHSVKKEMQNQVRE